MATASAADKRRILAEIARTQSHRKDSPTGRTLKLTLIGILIPAFVLVLFWGISFFSTPCQVLQVRALVKEQILELEKVGRNEAPLSYSNSGFGKMMEPVRGMSPEIRQQAAREMGRLFQARENAELNSYFAMPAAKRATELDRRIKGEEERRKARDTERAMSANRPQASPPATRSIGKGNSGADGGAVQAPVAGNNSSGGRPSGRRSGTEESRNVRSKQRIDSTTPEERSRQAEYWRAMELRRTQLGLGSGRGR
ncbi:MAG: hypothetical protein NTY87_11000 [Planctomycetia bacterium]|nr:hypothetical protein [Planctomycetia bacterium]